MATLYWFSLVVGAGLLLLSVFGDIFGGDADGLDDVDLDHDADGVDGMKILSLRTATYFLFAFGAVGVLLGALWRGGLWIVTLAAAAVTGTIAALVSHAILGYVRRTHSGDLPGDETLHGLAGTVTLPLSADGTGKVVVRRADREYELLARPFGREATAPEEWTSIVVVEIENGIALVTPAQAPTEA